MAYEINININDTNASQSTGVSRGITATEQDKALKSLGKYVSSQTIKPFISNVKNNISQNIQIVTGNSDLQQRVNFGFQIVEQGVSTFQNIQAGAVIGSSLGIGTFAGGAIGLALSAVTTGMQIGFSQYQINLQEKIENKQLQQEKTRAGEIYNKSRR